MKLSAPTAAIALILLVSSLLSSRVFADSSKLINATVGVNVCGNSAVEIPAEDCEGSDLNSGSCLSEGYGPGTLSCDISCAYDYSACTSPTPTPSPSAASNSQTNPATTSTVTNSSNSSAPENTSPTTVPIEIIPPSLPRSVIVFDPNNDGRIEITELYNAVLSWVSDWRNSASQFIGSDQPLPPDQKLDKCDINHDSNCDLVDLSTLLYYVGR